MIRPQLTYFFYHILIYARTLLIEELVVSTEGKTDCQEWDTDGWGGYSLCVATGS